jgi:hypothetical protein
LGAGILDRQAEARIRVGIGTALLGRDRDFARQLGEELGLDFVLLPLAVHDVLKLRMSGHTVAPRDRWGREMPAALSDG